jgi:hypothetical protein
MTRYMFIYHNPPMADEAMMDPDAMNAAMEQWNQWGAKVGPGLVDFGTPLGGGIHVAPDGTTEPSTRQVTGYTIVEADSIDTVLGWAKEHPHLLMPGGCEIEVHELLPVPGM